MSAAERSVTRHVRQFFAGHQVDVAEPVTGPVRQRVPSFDALRVGPGPRLHQWVFVSRGCWQATQVEGHGLEFAVCAPTSTPRAAEVLAMTAYYHAGPTSQRLDVGHTVPIGEPWDGVPMVGGHWRTVDVATRTGRVKFRVDARQAEAFVRALSPVA